MNRGPIHKSLTKEALRLMFRIKNSDHPESLYMDSGSEISDSNSDTNTDYEGMQEKMLNLENLEDVEEKPKEAIREGITQEIEGELEEDEYQEEELEEWEDEEHVEEEYKEQEEYAELKEQEENQEQNKAKEQEVEQSEGEDDVLVIDEEYVSPDCSDTEQQPNNIAEPQEPREIQVRQWNPAFDTNYHVATIKLHPSPRYTDSDDTDTDEY